jgi:protein-tyrosine phosphatase
VNRFLKIFTSKNNRQLLEDFSQVKVDFHSHLIPGIDDGVKTIEESIEILNLFHNYGFQKVITTPHVMSDYFRNDQKSIGEGFDKVINQLKQKEFKISFDYAAEYYLDYEILKILKEGNILTFSENYVLIEFSFFNPPENLTNIIFDLQSSGYKVVLAHPERYIFFHNNKEGYEELVDRQVYMQINGNSLLGEYGLNAKKAAQWLIQHNYVDFVGSDAHGKGHIEKFKGLLYNEHFYKLIKSGRLKNDQL